MKPARHIYLDHGATTPLLPEVGEAMAPYWSDVYGNPSSHHSSGRRAAQAVESAREVIADLLNDAPETILFTGCGSESNNLAIRGAMWAARAAGRGNHLVTSAIEHSAVLQTAKQLRDLHGFELTILPVDAYGRVNPKDVENVLRDDTVMISIMAASNEIGAIQPWASIGELARTHGVLFHTDAVQLAAARRWDLAAEPVDMMTIAPHKFYGPKGVGILYVRPGTDLAPSLTGGGHEFGLRAGTTNVPLVVGAAESFRLAMREMDERNDHYTQLRDTLLRELPALLPDTCLITGHPVERLPHNASFAFAGVSGNDLLMYLDVAGIAASSGSACSSGDPKPSAVLTALGLDDRWTKGGLRLTVGLQNSTDDIGYALEVLPVIVRRLQAIARAETAVALGEPA